MRSLLCFKQKYMLKTKNTEKAKGGKAFSN